MHQYEINPDPIRLNENEGWVYEGFIKSSLAVFTCDTAGCLLAIKVRQQRDIFATKLLDLLIEVNLLLMLPKSSERGNQC